MICKLAKISDVVADQWYEFSLQTDSGLVSIMVQFKNKEYIAFYNACPHQNRRMDYATDSFLTSQSGTIICPAHGAEFNPDTGFCINGPCRGQSLSTVHIQTNEESIFAVIK
jgi:nitrite reductase/ring-hydroxylating ferredoxin subunit